MNSMMADIDRPKLCTLRRRVPVVLICRYEGYYVCVAIPCQAEVQPYVHWLLDVGVHPVSTVINHLAVRQIGVSHDWWLTARARAVAAVMLSSVACCACETMVRCQAHNCDGSNADIA